MYIREVKVTEDGGVIKKVIQEGSGDQLPKKKNCVAVEYSSRLEDGTVFDQSDEGNPKVFPIGTGTLLKGWDLAIQTMKLGEKAEIIIEPEYAYGEEGAGDLVPKNAKIYCTTQIVKIDIHLKKLDRDMLESAQRVKDMGNELFK